ncbi:MAG: hypothetical protein U9P14_11280 [Gemmatimonadota bacterium]|nr:hypothetical protein [Gemmatimonadota bacterium]
MQVRQINGLTLYGPHPLDQEAGDAGHGIMLDIFPAYSSIIVGPGLHVNLALEFMEVLGDRRGGPLDGTEQDKVFSDMVAGTRRGKHLMVRSIPNDMEQVFRAAELLEKLVGADRIRFTGSWDAQVREAFKLRGECWKMTPRYFTIQEITAQIELSRVSVATENRYYYLMSSGGRLMTFPEFQAIGESMADPDTFRARVHEVAGLHQRRNIQYVLELDFFMVDEEKFDFSKICKLDEYLGACRKWGVHEQERAEELFQEAIENFRESLEPDYLRDDPNNPLWRSHMYSQLNDIPPTEESILGVSDEFNMNIEWLHGCNIEHSKAVIDSQTQDSMRSLITEFFRFYGPLEYINLGRVVRSQSQKRAAGSYREVFIAILKQRGSQVEQIRILRKVRRNTLYYLNRGYSLERAEQLAAGYLQYTFDRRELISMMGVLTPPVHSLKRKESIPGVGEVSNDTFDRPYVEGIATDKVPLYYFESEPFVSAFATLMGDAAALNLIIGRSDQNTGKVFFGDGDEMLQFEEDGHVPTSVMLADFTGVFADVVSPLEKFAPFYIEYMVEILGKVRIGYFKREQFIGIADLFIDSMGRRIEKTRQLLHPGDALDLRIREMLAGRDPELNPIMIKWEKILERLYGLDLENFIENSRAEVHQLLKYTF